jgi:hypothetical protein
LLTTLPCRHARHLWIQPEKKKKKNSSKKYTGMSGLDKNTSIIARRECQIFRRHLTQQTSRLPRVQWIFGGTHTLEHQPLWRILHRLRLSVRLIISCFSLWLTPPLGGQKNVFFFFPSFSLLCTAARPGTPPTNVTKSLVTR